MEPEASKEQLTGQSLDKLEGEGGEVQQKRES